MVLRRQFLIIFLDSQRQKKAAEVKADVGNNHDKFALEMLQGTQSLFSSSNFKVLSDYLQESSNELLVDMFLTYTCTHLTKTRGKDYFLIPQLRVHKTFNRGRDFATDAGIITKSDEEEDEEEEGERRDSFDSLPLAIAVQDVKNEDQ